MPGSKNQERVRRFPYLCTDRSKESWVRQSTSVRLAISIICNGKVFVLLIPEHP